MRCKRGEGGGEGGGTLWALDRSDFREVLVRSEASHTLQVASWPKPLPLTLSALTLTFTLSLSLSLSLTLSLTQTLTLQVAG